MKRNVFFESLLMVLFLLTVKANAQPIIANHENIILAEIPVDWIETAKSDLRIWYGHTSHGSQITSGITNLETHIGEPYTFNSSGSGGELSYQELNGYDLGHTGDLYWETLTRQQLDNPANNRNVVIWSWCGGASDNTVQGINIYLNAMNQLELDYPEVMFVYMTGHLDIWSDANLKARNQQIRDYCLANDKILFDFADIESYDPDGSFFEYANDNCNYYEGPGWGYLGNWAEEFCAENPESEYCWSCSCAHSEPANCNMKGRVFWWMLAKMAGWGEEQTVFYVDKNHPDANNENPGTAALPWLSIQHALDVAQAGDSVLICEGVYLESLATQNDGNPDDGHIVFAAYPAEAVVLDGTDGIETTGLRIENSYLKFYGIEIRNWPNTGIWMTGSAFVEMRDLEVSETTFGIGISGGSHDFLIRDTEVHHYSLYGFDASPMGDDFCYNGTFINCVAHTGRDPEQNVDGFALGHGEQNNFVFDHCITYDVYDGFDISSSATSLNACLAYDCWNTCYKLWQDEVELVNCIGHDGGISIVQLGWQEVPTETTLRNCTFSNAGVYTIWQANSNDILNMYNCIISGGENIGLCFEQSPAANYHGDYNLFQNNNAARAIYIGGLAEFSIADIQNGDWNVFSGQDENSLTATTTGEIYINPGADDFHLAPFSPAIDQAGTDYAPEADFDGNPRPFGDSPDMGAYESLQDLPIYIVSPQSINFGTVFTSQSVAETLTISNPGDIPITIDSISIDNEVFQVSDLIFPLQITDEVEIEITFEPELPQEYSGTLTFYSSQTFNTDVELTGTAIDEIIGGFHVSGNVSGMWQTYDSIFVDGDIIVPNGETLTVQAVPGGTDFIFTGHYKFIVYGRLRLLGDAQDSIRLYSLNRQEGWFGLRFYDLNYNGMDSSQVQFCSFKYGNAIGEDWDNYGGGIFIYESSRVSVSDCSIVDNHADDSGGGVHIRYCLPLLKRLNIINNSAPFGGGIMIWGSYPQISWCIIGNNEAETGGGININGGSPVLDHVTISGNSATQGAGIFQMDGSYPEFSNSIIRGNIGDDIHINPDGGAVIASYSDIGGAGLHPGNGNINADPLFAGNTNGDFRLTWENFPVQDETKSPCINSGDPGFPPDPDGSITEMGALFFEAEQGNHIPEGEISGVWENEETIWIDGNIIVPFGETLEIVPLAGGTDIVFSGSYSITVYGRLLLSGNVNDSIIFNAENTDTGWRGIRFLNTNENEQENSEIHFCAFNNSNKLTKNDNMGGAILLSNSSNVIITNSLFLSNEAENGGALALVNSSPIMNDLVVAGNLAYLGGGIYFEDDALVPTPEPAGLLHAENWEYKGAFRLPESSGGSNWNYSASASTFFPDGDSLGANDGYPGSIYALGHDWYFDISEIDIPIPIISPTKNPGDLNTANTLQPFTNVTSGVFDTIAYEIIRMGLEYIPAQGLQSSGNLYMCVGQHLQFVHDYSHISLSTDLSNPQTSGPWYFGNIDNYRSNDYMFSIPETWAQNHVSGRMLICGRYRDGGWSGKGPNLFAFAPWQEGNPPPPEYELQNITHLLGYSDNDSLDGYKHADEWNGGAWLTYDTLASVAIVGTKALGDCWYGFADGTLWPNDSNYIPPYPYDQRGWWADDYQARILFYNPDDLAAVAAGSLLPYEPQPYDHLDIGEFLYNPQHDLGQYQLGSCCYDRQNGLIYIFERIADGDKSLVHVFQIVSPPRKQVVLEDTNVFRNLSLLNNWADGSGGGFYIKNSSPHIENIEMEGNGASDFGGAICVVGNASPSLFNLLISDNMAEWGGAVAVIENLGIPGFFNNTMVNNHAFSGGGAMYFDSATSCTKNSILWFNTADGEGNQVFIQNENSHPEFHYSNIGGGVELFGGTGAGVNYNMDHYQNNIDADPLFEDILWNFRLSLPSPSINSGDPYTGENELSNVDLDQLPRIAAWVIDMGCFENQEFEAREQTLIIPAGWSSISMSLNPYFSELESIFENDMDDLIILQNMTGVFWPGQNVNTMGSWDYQSGYVIKMSEAANITVPGATITNKTIALQQGWNLIPVLCENGISCNEVLEQLGENLIIIKEPASTNVFWPGMNIQSLAMLQQGKAYLILVNSAAQLTFPGE